MTGRSSPHVSHKCVMCTLRTNAFFCDLPAPILAVFERLAHLKSYPAGTFLFSEGQAPHGIYVLCSGQAKLSVTSRSGKAIIVKMSAPGEVLGLNSCLCGSAHDVTAQAIEPTQAKFVSRQDLLQFLRAHGAACLKAAEHLSAAHDNALRVIQKVAVSHSGEEKLARLLLEQAAAGEQTAAGIRFSMSQTHEELGQAIGMSRETVTRLMIAFKKKNIIAVRGVSVTIRDRRTLERLIGS